MEMVMSYVNLRQNSVKYDRPMMFEYAANGNDCVHVQKKTITHKIPCGRPIIIVK